MSRSYHLWAFGLRKQQVLGRSAWFHLEYVLCVTLLLWSLAPSGSRRGGGSASTSCRYLALYLALAGSLKMSQKSEKVLPVFDHKLTDAAEGDRVLSADRSRIEGEGVLGAAADMSLVGMCTKTIISHVTSTSSSFLLTPCRTPFLPQSLTHRPPLRAALPIREDELSTVGWRRPDHAIKSVIWVDLYWTD